MSGEHAPPSGVHPERLELRDLLSLLWRRKWLIAFTTVLALGATLYYTSKQTPLYRSGARVLVTPLGPLSYSTFFYGPVNLDTESALATSLPVAEKAVQVARSSASPAGILGGLSVGAEPDADILDFAYTSTDPNEAQRYAQAFAEGYLLFRQDRALEQVKTQAADLKSQIGSVSQQLAGLRKRMSKVTDAGKLSSLSGVQTQLSARYGVLQQQLQTLNGTNAIAGGGGDVVQPAPLPGAPFSPTPFKNGSLAIFAGLALGIATSLLLERLDDRILSRRDFGRQLGAPVLATIPKVPGWKKRNTTQLAVLESPRSPAAEAYRSLRTNVQYMGREHQVRLLTVTSPVMSEGKTTTVANLATALALSGSRVIAVSCDLRKPRLHTFFGLGNQVGVVSILQDKSSVMDAIQRTDVDNLRLISSGPVPADPAELLSGARMEALIASLREIADFVLFDTPPLMAVADAQILGPKTDGIIIVADAGRATRSEVRFIREELEQVGGDILGGVFNNLDAAAAGYYSAEYRRRYASYYNLDGSKPS